MGHSIRGYISDRFVWNKGLGISDHDFEESSTILHDLQ